VGVSPTTQVPRPTRVPLFLCSLENVIVPQEQGRFDQTRTWMKVYYAVSSHRLALITVRLHVEWLEQSVKPEVHRTSTSSLSPISSGSRQITIPRHRGYPSLSIDPAIVTKSPTFIDNLQVSHTHRLKFAVRP
jgi:hypothetical protein